MTTSCSSEIEISLRRSRHPGRRPDGPGTTQPCRLGTIAHAVALVVLAAAVSSSRAAPPWPANPNWQAYNMVPTGASVCPVRVQSTSGSVTNAQAILCNGGGGATLSMTAGGPTPRIVLDYGKDVGGLPWLDVGAASGNPQMKVGYDEAALYLTDDGGDAAPGGGEGDVNRFDVYAVAAPGLITNRYTQGGERFQVITLTSPGSVTLRGAGINYIADRTQAANYGGYFMSSDDELNKVWFSGAYTAQLDAVPSHSLPGGYRVENGALSAFGDHASNGSDIGPYTPGTGWKNYTMAFDTAIVNQQSGWAIRARDPQNGLVFLLRSNTLQAFTAVGNTYTQIASVATPFTINPGTWYGISTSVSASTAKVRINGRLVLTVDTGNFAKGTIGFREWGPEEAHFRNLVVKDASGSVLLNRPFGNPADLAGFRAPGGNDVASNLDGAKRDRNVWSGDLDTSSPTLAYSLGNNDYAKGSLQLFATRQHASGFVEGVVSPAVPVITATGLTSETGPYSATYSMYFVLGLHDHLMYSGDRAFASSMWPVVQRQLAWNATRLDARGLFITRDGVDGADWDFYDPDKAGAITEYNVIYYRTLLAAAEIGDAIGQSSAASSYRAQANTLRNAINAAMYDASRGVYRISDTVPVIAQDANALAILAGVAPTAETPRILAAMKTALWTNPYGPMPFNDPFWKPVVSTFISGYEAQARYLANDPAGAEQLIHTVFGRLANPANLQYTGTMWENVGADGTPGLGSTTSLSHAWATGAVSALSGYALGIRPTAPGFDTWLVQAHPGTLDWAVGQAPTPHGALAVKWAGERGVGQFSMQVDAPAGTSGTIAVPTYGAVDPVVAINGVAAWRNGVFIAGNGASSASTDGQFVYLNGIQPGSITVASNPGNAGLPSGFATCAAEGGTCTTSGTHTAAFGANGIYAYASVAGSFNCGAPTFADADYGFVKSCAFGPSVPAPLGGTFCAAENGLCSFPGTRTVAYGTATAYNTKSIGGGTPCTNAVFGDPAAGTPKSCFILP